MGEWPEDEEPMYRRQESEKNAVFIYILYTKNKMAGILRSKRSRKLKKYSRCARGVHVQLKDSNKGGCYKR